MIGAAGWSAPAVVVAVVRARVSKRPRRLVFFKPSLLVSLPWGRRYAPPPLKKLSFLSLPTTRRLRQFRWLVFHTSS
jgi:hypothetical protein